MEIQFDKKTSACFAQLGRWERQIQLDLEGVVPDTQEDIGRVVTVRPSVCLKSKEVESGRITIGGEVQAVLLYITENEDRLSAVRLSKPFDLSIEEPEISADNQAIVRLHMSNCQAKVLNPRKVSVTAEVTASLRAFEDAEAVLDWRPPENAAEELLVKIEASEAFWIKHLGEKSFAVAEQFSFSRENEPDELLTQQAVFHSLTCQQVGSRAIIRGTVEIEVYTLCEGCGRAQRQVFTTPFSQIMEVGEAVMDLGLADVELTSAYFELVDSISGGKALDVELHAVLQLLGFGKKTLHYTADAYSNRVPVLCTREELLPLVGVREHAECLSGEEALEIAEDCAKLLCVFPGILQTSLTDGSLSATVQLELLYETNRGSLSCVKRTMTLTRPLSCHPEEITGVRLNMLELRVEGTKALCRAEFAVCCLCCQHAALSAVCEAVLQEENPYSIEEYPSLTLVRAEGESLWELAKQYHSSAAAISALNDCGDSVQSGSLLMIPKQI